MSIQQGVYYVIIIVTAILGYIVLLNMAEPRFLSTKLIPFFSALAQIRFIGPLKQLMYLLKVSASIVSRLNSVFLGLSFFFFFGLSI